MRKFMLLLLPLAVAVVAANASNPVSLGYSTETTISEPDTRACSSGALHYNHNGSFENGYAWQYDGVVPPYYGCFGEAYDLGAVTVHCGAYWLTQIGYFTGQRADCYVWEGGVTRPPGAVVGVVTGVLFSGIAYWPSISQHDVDLNIDVTGEFTVGYWGNWPGSGPCGWYVAADLDGEQGHPWTNIAPGIGYPTGWQDPSIVWGYTPALGIGVWAGLSAAACCQGDVCTISTESECTGLGGEWHPDCVSCDPNPCVAGACCTDGVCSIVPEHECTGIDAEWHSEWTSCDPNPCPPPPLRACCLLGECTLLTRSVCEGTGGMWHLDWETCDPNPCWQPGDCDDYAGTPEIVGSVETPGTAIGVAVREGLAYVADYRSGLQVIDVTDPASPQIVGGVDTPGGAANVAVSGTHAYVADYGSGLQVIDITDPRSPQIVGSVDTWGWANGVAVTGAYAYVADSHYGLYVIDITDPYSPQIVGSVNMCYPYRLVVLGSYAYVADEACGLQVVDITNPANPRIVGGVETPAQAMDVAVSGGYACVAAWTSGLQVIDVTNPASPQIAGSVDTPDCADAVTVEGNYAYVGDDHSGLQVVDIRNPQSPQLVGSLDTPDRAVGVAVSWPSVYVADCASGLQILPAQCDPASNPDADYQITSTMLLRTYPNPGSGQALIRFQTRDEGPVRAGVYDLAGRLVRELSDGVFGAGVHELSWDERDGASRAVKAGIYLIRLSTAEGTTTERLVILR